MTEQLPPAHARLALRKVWWRGEPAVFVGDLPGNHHQIVAACHAKLGAEIPYTDTSTLQATPPPLRLPCTACARLALGSHTAQAPDGLRVKA